MIGQLEVEFIRRLVREHSAIEIEPNKGYLIEARLEGLVRETGCESINSFVGILRDQHSVPLQHKVVEAMTTNETLFFRDNSPFEALRADVLPAMIKSRASSRRIRIWCAACSTGQEPYSIAMLLKEHFPELQSWDLRIMGTDFSSQTLARARSGRYSQMEVNRGLPAKYLVKNFERAGTEWQLKPDVLRMVEFREFNLKESWPADFCFDIIFMRNVLIYFDIETKKSIFHKIRGALAPGGVLFLGAVETTVGIDPAFHRVPETQNRAFYSSS